MVFLSLVLTYYIRFESGLFEHAADYLPFRAYLLPVYFLIPIYLVLYNITGQYKSDRKISLSFEIYDLIRTHAFGLPVFISILFAQRTIDYSRLFIILYALVHVSLTLLERYGLLQVKRYVIRVSKQSNKVLIVGFSNVAKEYIRKSNELSGVNYVIEGILDDHTKLGYTYGGTKVLGNCSLLEEKLKASDINEVIIAVVMDDFPKINDYVDLCETYGVHTKFIPDYYQYIPNRPYVEDFDGLPMISIRKIPLNDYMNRFIKRSMDITASFLGLLLLSPLLLLMAALVKITSPGPVFFKQTRVGLNRNDFTIYKFRSMTIQNPNKEKSAWTTKNDVRVTGLGGFMRKTNIDELPQLINVLKGDMSLIGPRPERPYFVEQFMHTIPRYMIKHQVRPGMSGWAQVHGWRGDTSIEERIKHDIYYIENWTLMMDLQILFLTLFGRRTNRDAY